MTTLKKAKYNNRFLTKPLSADKKGCQTLDIKRTLKLTKKCKYLNKNKNKSVGKKKLKK